MNRHQLVEKIAVNLRLPPNEVCEIYEAIFREIRLAVARGERVKVNNFGSFYTRLFKASRVCPPGQATKALGARMKPRFCASKIFQEQTQEQFLDKK